MLLGSRITVFTDHKTLTHEMTKFSTQWVLCWWLQLEEYSAKFHYKKGEGNVLADALNRGPCQPEGVCTAPMQSESTIKADTQWSILNEPALAECLAQFPLRPAGLVTDHNKGSLRPAGLVADHTMTHTQKSNDLLLEHMEFDDEGRVPFHFKTVYEYQQQDPILATLPQQSPEKYVIHLLGNYQIICAHTKTGVYMCLIDLMFPKVIKYFHEVTVHNEGMVWLEQMIQHWFYHPQITEQVKQHVQGCLICQKMKPGVHGCGELPAHSMNAPPWHEVHVDCIGPWMIELCGDMNISLTH